MDAYLKELDAALVSAMGKLKEELRGIRSNRPSAEFVSDIKAVYYDSPTPISHIGTVTISGQSILITPWDKAAMGPISTAILNANAGFSVSSEGNVIRATLSPLSSERREELSKIAKKTVETIRIQVRGIRDDVMKKVRSAKDGGEITEDQEFSLKDKLEKRVKEANETTEKMLQEKIKEISE